MGRSRSATKQRSMPPTGDEPMTDRNIAETGEGSWRFTGRHMFFILLGFFGTTITANIVLAVLATQSWTGLVVKNSYVASQQFNRTLSEAHKQKLLGWRSTVFYRAGRLTVDLDDKLGKAVTGMRLRVAIARPTHEREDQTVELIEKDVGLYTAPAKLNPGVWLVTISARNRFGQKFKKIHRILVEKDS